MLSFGHADGHGSQKLSYLPDGMWHILHNHDGLLNLGGKGGGIEGVWKEGNLSKRGVLTMGEGVWMEVDF